WGTPITGPQISVQPTNVNLVEGNLAFFNVRVTNVGAMSYRWQREQANIAGATNASYTRGPVTLADNGTHYRCLLSNSVTTAFSAEVILNVSPDTIPPHLASA